jgi:hypothetical protein
MKQHDDHPESILPPCIFQVVIADTAPFQVLQEPIRHRVVDIALTNKQREQLRLQRTGTSSGRPIYENISAVYV